MAEENASQACRAGAGGRSFAPRLGLGGGRSTLGVATGFGCRSVPLGNGAAFSFSPSPHSPNRPFSGEHSPVSLCDQSPAPNARAGGRALDIRLRLGAELFLGGWPTHRAMSGFVGAELFPSSERVRLFLALLSHSFLIGVSPGGVPPSHSATSRQPRECGPEPGFRFETIPPRHQEPPISI